jgi:hypothetical protein
MQTVLQGKSVTFYQGFLMARGNFQPKDFGVDMTREDFTDQMVDEFGNAFKGELTIDELLLRPRSAINFCDSVRAKFGYYDLPDDIILRVILTRRKKPGS